MLGVSAMARPAALMRLLLLLGLQRICGGLKHGNCTDYQLQFERVFSVPGDTALLNSSLVAPDVFDFAAVPFSVSWFQPGGERMSNRSGRVLLAGAALWLLQLQLEDSGDYVTILRTPTRCYRQATRLLVEPPPAAGCGRPRRSQQTLTSRVTDMLHCPLVAYREQLQRHHVASQLTWYRGCERIVDGEGRYAYWDTRLKIEGVEPHHNSSYTCTLTFTLGGANGSVSETIEASVSEKYSLTPQIHEPANQRLPALPGSRYSQRCRVFVPCVGRPNVFVVWKDRHAAYVLNAQPHGHISTARARSRRQEVPERGVWLEEVLMFSQLTEEDFYVNYTCEAHSARGTVQGYFSLLPTDPGLLLPVVSALGGVTSLFIVGVVLFFLLKVDVVLWFRRTFPDLYASTERDGKRFDAYVAFPPCSPELAAFALQALPRVLEDACGYKLFIAGRDCKPGTAVVDSVEENIQASRRLLLLYTASTFTSRRHTNNNNNKSSEDVYPESRQQLECVTAMHRALLEGSLKVILVEMERVSPAQLALFPEALRHLRRTQGAVRWWRSPRRCCRGAEPGAGHVLCPASSFWKEVRYRMPVRGKRALHPETTALMDL